MLNISFRNSNYNHSTLVNNPPYISNHPVLDYMDSVRIDFNPYDYAMLRQEVKQQKREETYASCLLAGAIATIGATGIYARNKIKKLSKKLKFFIKPS